MATFTTVVHKNTPAATYTTIQAAIDNIDSWAGTTGGDLAAAGNLAIIELELETSSPPNISFTETVDVDGITADASSYLTIIAQPSERHDGTRISGIRVLRNATGHAFNVTADFTRIIGLEIKSGTTSSEEGIRLLSGVVGVQIHKCLIEGRGSTSSPNGQDGIYAGDWNVGSATAGEAINVTNCYFFGWSRCGIHSQAYGSDEIHHYWEIYNCTFLQCEHGIGWRHNDSLTTVNMDIENCIGGDNDNGDLYETPSSSTGTFNVSGSNNWGEYTTGGTDAFPGNISGGSDVTDSTASGTNTVIIEDVDATYTVTIARLVDDTDNDCLATGTGSGTDSLVPTDDFADNARPSGQCDPGWHEISAVAGGPVEDGSMLMGFSF